MKRFRINYRIRYNCLAPTQSNSIILLRTSPLLLEMNSCSNETQSYRFFPIQDVSSLLIYSTREPQLAFHQRISFCLDLHNQSVKAMRYPPKSYGQELESAEERREREQQNLELAKEMAEEDDDGF